MEEVKERLREMREVHQMYMRGYRPRFLWEGDIHEAVSNHRITLSVHDDTFTEIGGKRGIFYGFARLEKGVGGPTHEFVGEKVSHPDGKGTLLGIYHLFKEGTERYEGSMVRSELFGEPGWLEEIREKVENRFEGSVGAELLRHGENMGRLVIRVLTKDPEEAKEVVKKLLEVYKEEGLIRGM